MNYRAGIFAFFTLLLVVLPGVAAQSGEIISFNAEPTGTLYDYAVNWQVAGTDTAVLQLHLPGDPSGEPMLELDELPLEGGQVVTVPFHTPDTGVRFVLWGVNRVENPPSPQERYDYIVQETIEFPPFATPIASPTATAQATEPGPSPTLPTLTPSPTYTPDPDGDFYTVQSTYQRFDGGFMIWRSDSGFIWALAYDGRVFFHPLSSYGNLPLPDARVILPPPGKFLPTMGFGRVWHNFPAVRNALGWPATSESSFNLGVQHALDILRLRLPDQRWIEILPNSTWRYRDNPGPVPPVTVAPPTATFPAPNGTVTGATYQPFANGFMVWRADRGDILVFNGHTSGTMQIYLLGGYATLPDNPFPGQPPVGSVRPIFGFGKVWGNFPSVRNALGWASGSEEGYTMNIRFLPGGSLGSFDAVFNLPDGRDVLVENGLWQYAS